MRMRAVMVTIRYSIRPDKRAEEADTIDAVRRIFAAQGGANTSEGATREAEGGGPLAG